MTAEEAHEIQKQLDPNLIEFYKDKPLDQFEIDFFDDMVEREIRKGIQKVVDNFGKPNRSTTPFAWIEGQWSNSRLKQYLLERGFKIQPDGNGTDIWVTW